MSTVQIQVPDVGSDSEVEVIEILVSEGDNIAIDDPVVVLESDKASIEVPATAAGVIQTINVKVGDQVKQGDVLLDVSGDSADVSASIPVSDDAGGEESDIEEASSKSNASDEVSASEQSSSQPQRVEVRVPDVGGAEEVEVIEISVQVGAKVDVDDALLVVESDKASMDIPSPCAGNVLELKISVGDKVGEGDLIAIVEGVSQSSPKPQAPGSDTSNKAPPASVAPSIENVNKSAPASSSTSTESAGDHVASANVHAGPAVRKLARELGVDLSRVKPSGPKSRIQKDDLHAYIKDQVQAAQSGQVGTAISAPKLPDFTQFGNIESRKMERLQLVTAKNMQSSWTNIPHVTQFDEADITELEAFRKSKKADAAARDVKLTPLPFMIKACAQALRDLPQFNVSLDMANQQVIHKKYFHIGVAVDTSYGLVVPVIRDVDQKDLWQIAAELGELAEKAKARKLSPQEMQGACFTISSLGSIGGTAFTPIVNQPEVAILGVSKAQTKPVYAGDGFTPRLMLPLSLSYDHRAVNGADAARFTSAVAKYLSDIRELLF